MKKYRNTVKFFFCFAAAVFLFGVSCKKGTEQQREITVYAYDSFCSDYGPGAEIAKEFEKETSVHVNLIGCGSATQLYNRLVLEGKNSDADVLIGLSDSMQIDESLFYSWQPICKNDLIEYPSDKMIPFNYGYYAFLKNTKFGFDNTPSCLNDLVKPEFGKSFVLIDPRTSSVGLGLLKWTIISMGEEKAFEWWKKACNNALTVADSWSSAYGIFTAGEVPFVISYTTSPVYHRMYENDYSVKEMIFTDGHVRTTEYLSIPETSDKKEDAKRFCEYVLTKGQEKIAVSITMFPANSKTVLPEAFSDCVMPAELYDNSDFILKQTYYLDKWSESVVE